jgi:superfamily II DNA or RNA helicase
MTILNGSYTSERLTDEYSFCLWSEDGNDLQFALEKKLEQIEDLGLCFQKGKVLIPRVKLAEALLSVMDWNIEFAEPLRTWTKVTSWVKQLVELGCFYPGIVPCEDVYYSRWLVDYSPTKVDEDLQEFVNLFSVISDQEAWGNIIPAFVSDCLDSYIRFVINTRFSLQGSDLGKFLRYKPFYLHEEWFNRLCAEEYIPGTGKRWEELFVQVGAWTKGRVEERRNLGRLGLQLHTPEEGEWYIQFVWHDMDGRMKNWDQLNHAQIRHDFLRQLAEAGAVYPMLALRWEHAPYYCPVNMEEAHAFLKQIAPQLRLKGFSVWAATSLIRSKKASIGMEYNLRPLMENQGGFIRLDSLLDFDLRLVLGSEQINAEQLERLVEQNKPFIKWNGEWVLLDHEQLKKAVDWVRDQTKKSQVTLKEALYMQAMKEDTNYLPLPIYSFQSEGWVKDWFDRIEEKKPFELLPQPDVFEGHLRPYQQVGMSWLIHLREWGMGACLSDDMGLGKTIQFLAYLAFCKVKGRLHGPFLLLCPTSVLGNWQKEIERFVPNITVYTHHGSGRLEGESFVNQTKEVDMVLTTYSIIQRDFPDMEKIFWDGIVLDEAQYIKNSSTIQSKAIRRIPCHHRIALTGTPIENRLDELWSIFEFLNHGYLGSLQGFRREFVQPIEKTRDEERLNSLKKLIRPFFLRRSKNDPAVVSDLPEKIEKKEYCYLTAEQAVLYEQVVNHLLQQEGKMLGMERKGLILAAISRLKQICNHPHLVVPDRAHSSNVSGKMTRLLEMVGEMIGEGDRILIFTQFAKMGGILKETLQSQWNREIPFLHGGVRKQQRDQMVEQFQDDQGSPVFLLSLKAGGIGLNLTRANRVIHFDRWWNPAVENQATDRAYRIGQKQTVHVHKMICTGTIEEKIDLMMERKQHLVTEIIHTGENWVTELSSGELRDLVTLRNELIE